METLVENLSRNTMQSAAVRQEAAPSLRRNGLAKRYEALMEELTFSHFAVIAMAILIGSCLGSISSMFMFYHHAPIWVFAIGLFASIANLVTCIAQAPTKWVVNVFAASFLVNLVLICIYPIL